MTAGRNSKGGARGRAADEQVTATLDALRRIFRAARAAAQGAEQRLGLSGAQHFVLEQLARAPAPSVTDSIARRSV